jgi:hypothetical protein
MNRTSLIRLLNPWRFERERRQLRLAELRRRDGDKCTRCRRPLRFDLPPGHEQAPAIEPLLPQSNGDNRSLDSLCLTHRRCNAQGIDHTEEVMERLRPAREAELFAKPRKKRAA